MSNAIQFASKAGVKLGKTKNSHAEKIEEASCPIPLWSVSKPLRVRWIAFPIRRSSLV